MKHRNRILALVGVVSLALTLALSAGASTTAGGADAIRPEVTIASPVLLAGAKQTTYLKVALTGVDIRPGTRAPVNLAIVLDRSGSMQGTKIEQAKQAAIAAIGQLQADDIVSVVTYANGVHVLVPATKLSDKESVYRHIRSISANGGTALFAGVSKGAREARKFAGNERVTSVMLLSDGLANVGPSSPGALADLGSSLGREGITVTTIGLGLGFNEDLMVQLAARSEGNHFFVENATDLAAVFATEFGDAISATAQNASVRIECPSGIRPVRVLGRDANINGQRIDAYLSHIYRGQTKYLIVEVEVAPGIAGRSTRPVAVTASYRDLLTGQARTVGAGANLRFTTSHAEVAAAEHRETTIDAVRAIAVENTTVAVALRDEGKIEEARQAFQDNASWTADNAGQWDSQELRTLSATQADAAENLDPEKWKVQRKLQLEQNMKTIQNRAVTPRKGEKE